MPVLDESEIGSCIYVKYSPDFPHTVTVHMRDSVRMITYKEFDGEWLCFVIQPCFLSNLNMIIPRRITFSKKDFPELPYEYLKAGQFEFDGEEVFVFLEK